MLNVRPVVFAIVVAAVTGHESLGFTRKACAQSITAGTYNIRVAVLPPQIEEFINIRRHLIFESIVAKQPDIMGFQEAYARTTNSEGVTQQTALGQLFEETNWQYYSWEAENEFNMNPIIVNTDRLDVVGVGVFGPAQPVSRLCGRRSANRVGRFTGITERGRTRLSQVQGNCV